MRAYRFPRKLINNSCTVTAQGAMDANGVSTGTAVTKDCYYEEGVKTIRSPTGEIVARLSLIVILGDVTGLTNENKGAATVEGKTGKIETIERFYNPDRSVHHIELMVK